MAMSSKNNQSNFYTERVILWNGIDIFVSPILSLQLPRSFILAKRSRPGCRASSANQIRRRRSANGIRAFLSDGSFNVDFGVDGALERSDVDDAGIAVDDVSSGRRIDEAFERRGWSKTTQDDQNRQSERRR